MVGAASSRPNVHRVTQLDAIFTLTELRSLLTKSLSRIFAVGVLKSIPYTYQEELHLGLDLVLFRFSTYRMGASVGDRLQNLVMRDEVKAEELNMQHLTQLVPTLAPSRYVLLLHALLNIVVPYALTKLHRRILEEDWRGTETSDWRHHVAKIIHAMYLSWSLLSILNTVHFLATGKYRTLVERLLGLRMVNGTQSVMRLTNLMYLNQAVIWQAVSGLCEALNIGKVVRKITASAYSIATTAREATPENRCCACHELPTISQRSNCGHLYCYFCIQSRLLHSEAEGSFPCLRCGKRVSESHPDC